MANMLWKPMELGSVELRNRIVMPPMVTQYATSDGRVTDRQKSYYEARARGGAGLIIAEATYIERRGQSFQNQLGISDDAYVSGLSDLVAAVHRHGAAAAIQLHHGGRTAKPELTGGRPVAPSPVPLPGGEPPDELSIEGIRAIVRSFAAAAGRAKRAGFDGVELHAAHSYLIDQFLSPVSNRRTDAYGGAVENRSRLLVEVIQAVRNEVGREYPVWCRLNAKEFGLDGGTSLRDAQTTAGLAEQAGAHAIHVSAYGPETPTNLTTRTFMPGVILDLAAAIKKAVKVPIIAVGRITPEAGENALREGKADLVAMGKALLADPELPNKVRTGKLEDVRPCIVCMECRDALYYPDVLGIRCSVNPWLGREGEHGGSGSRHSRRVLVVGGGPAGMQAGLDAAGRGHKVTLWERGPRLGGQLLQAAVPPHKDRIAAFIDYLETQLKKAGVKVEVLKEATLQSVEQFEPEAVVVATGTRPLMPRIPGLDTGRAVFAGDVLEGKATVGSRVAVIGAERIGCEVAEFLAEKGKQVVLMRRGLEIGSTIGPSLRTFVLKRLQQEGVTLMPGVSYREVSPSGITVTTGDGQTRVVPADAIVVAAGSVPDTAVYEQLKDGSWDVYLAGDCVKPRTIRDAVREGTDVATKI